MVEDFYVTDCWGWVGYFYFGAFFFCGGVKGGSREGEGREKGRGGGKGAGRRMAGGSWQRVASHCPPATGAG